VRVKSVLWPVHQKFAKVERSLVPIEPTQVSGQMPAGAQHKLSAAGAAGSTLHAHLRSGSARGGARREALTNSGFPTHAAAALERQRYFCSIDAVIEPAAAVGRLVQHNVSLVADATVELSLYPCVQPLFQQTAAVLGRCTCVWRNPCPLWQALRAASSVPK